MWKWDVRKHQSDVHVLPIDDTMEHTENRLCLCRPYVEEIAEHAVVVHHSADGREYFEPGYQPPKPEIAQ